MSLVSFGFKHGLPMEADLVFDVRCLPNPFYVTELRPLTGLDAGVRDYVFQNGQAEEFLKRLWDLVSWLLPRYEEEGKTVPGHLHRLHRRAPPLCCHCPRSGGENQGPGLAGGGEPPGFRAKLRRGSHGT